MLAGEKKCLQYHEVYLVGVRQLTQFLKSNYLGTLSKLKNSAGNLGFCYVGDENILIDIQTISGSPS